MKCPNCGAAFGEPDALEHGTRGWCPRCKCNLIWIGNKWVRGKRNVFWWRRPANHEDEAA